MNLENLLDTVLDTVEEHWPFNDENYPPMRRLVGAEPRRRFALRHILMHQQKAVAKLTEVVEPLDHGASLDEEKLRQATRNFLINTLRLATIVGVSADDLSSDVQAWARDEHVP